jgi:hypothetical protein
MCCIDRLKSQGKSKRSESANGDQMNVGFRRRS